MKYIKIILALMFIIIINSCTMDDFLFNTQKFDKYLLPGNDIPDSLIKCVELNSSGNKLYAFYIKSPGATKTILYSHGNKHNIDEYWDRVKLMFRMGVNVFIYDYRGFGLSEGTSSEKGLQEDAFEALKYVQSNLTRRDTLILMGYSLGGYPTVYLCAEKVTPYKVILEAPFASANSLTQSVIGLDVPGGWLTEGKFDNAENIKKNKAPLLLIHGDSDDFVRFKDNGLVVYDNATSPKKLEVVKGALHTNIPTVMGESEYIKLLSDWIK